MSLEYEEELLYSDQIYLKYQLVPFYWHYLNYINIIISITPLYKFNEMVNIIMVYITNWGEVRSFHFFPRNHWFYI